MNVSMESGVAQGFSCRRQRCGILLTKPDYIELAFPPTAFDLDPSNFEFVVSANSQDVMLICNKTAWMASHV